MAEPVTRGGDHGQSRGPGKSPSAYRTISEVSTELGVPQHVLRFWETKFSQVRPLKRGGGRRYYRPEDLRLLRIIRKLLYDDGYTIKGVQKLLREGRAALRADQAAAEALARPHPEVEDARPDAPADEAGEDAPPEPDDDGEGGESFEEPERRSAETDLFAGVDPLVSAPRLTPSIRNALNDVLRELKAVKELLARSRGEGREDE